MVLRERIELSTSSLPMTRSTTELPQHNARHAFLWAGEYDQNTQCASLIWTLCVPHAKRGHGDQKDIFAHATHEK